MRFRLRTLFIALVVICGFWLLRGSPIGMVFWGAYVTILSLAFWQLHRAAK